jgi:hypothetical protein
MTETLYAVGNSFPMKWDDLVVENEDGVNLRMVIQSHNKLLSEWYDKYQMDDIEEGEPPERPSGIFVEIDEKEDAPDIYEITAPCDIDERILKLTLETVNEQYDENFEFGGLDGYTFRPVEK